MSLRAAAARLSSSRVSPSRIAPWSSDDREREHRRPRRARRAAAASGWGSGRRRGRGRRRPVAGARAGPASSARLTIATAPTTVICHAQSIPAPRMNPRTTATSAAAVARSSPPALAGATGRRPRRQERAPDQQQPDDPQLPERLQPQRVGVADEVRDAAVLGPPALVAARAVTGHRVGAELVHRGAPELPAARAAAAGQVGRDVALLLLPGNRVRGRLLELVHALARAGDEHRRDHRERRGGPHRHLDCARRRPAARGHARIAPTPRPSRPPAPSTSSAALRPWLIAVDECSGPSTSVRRAWSTSTAAAAPAPPTSSAQVVSRRRGENARNAIAPAAATATAPRDEVM